MAAGSGLRPRSLRKQSLRGSVADPVRLERIAYLQGHPGYFSGHTLSCDRALATTLESAGACPGLRCHRRRCRVQLDPPGASGNAAANVVRTAREADGSGHARAADCVVSGLTKWEGSPILQKDFPILPGPVAQLARALR